MGTCLAVIKVVGLSTLGLYTGGVATNVLSGYDILKFVLDKTATISNLDTVNKFIRSKLSLNGIILNVLGAISSFAFQLAYFGAPARSKHPYLIYSSLVFPLSYLTYYNLARSEVSMFYRLKELGVDASTRDAKKEKQRPQKDYLRSDLDNSAYKDLGDSSSVDGNEESIEELLGHDGQEVEKEVEFHLNRHTGLNALNRIHFSDQIVFSLSTLGFLVASVGVYGDY